MYTHSSLLGWMTSRWSLLPGASLLSIEKCFKRGFSALALWTWGWITLCTPDASGTPSPSRGNTKRVQALPDVPWRAQAPPVAGMSFSSPGRPDSMTPFRVQVKCSDDTLTHPPLTYHSEHTCGDGYTIISVLFCCMSLPLNFGSP